MKVLLINPPYKSDFPQPPLGIAYVASALEKSGQQVEILDAPALKLNADEVVKHVLKGSFDIVGITAMTPTIRSAIEVAKKIKDQEKSIIVILGGAHATVLPEKTLEMFPEINFIIVGEGEVTTPELIEKLEKGKSLKDISGIAYKDNGKIILNPRRPVVENLDELPMPAYHLLPIGKYRPHPPHGKRLPYMALITSRGCPFRCTFCSKPVHGTKYRAKNAVSIIEEIKFLKDKYGIREILFYDDSFTIDKQRIINLCDEMIKNKIDLPWSCETRVNLVDKELLSKMKKAGCYIISYGVESGNQEILDNIKKDITIEQIRNAFKLTHEEGIDTVSYFMLGCPGETEQTMKQTIDFAKNLNTNFAQFSICTPFPGTELADLVKEEIDWNKLSYVSDSSDRIPVILSEHLNEEQLKKYYSKAYKEFYLRPSYVAKMIGGIRSIEDVKIMMNGMKMFLKMLR